MKKTRSVKTISAFEFMEKFPDDNEFSFRLNEGNCAVDTMERIDSLCGSLCGKRITYTELTAE